MTLTRNEIDIINTWNLSSLYPSTDAWEKDFALFKGEENSPHWPKLASFRHRLGSSLPIFVEALDTFFTLARNLEKLYTYAHLKHDEEITDTLHKEMLERSQILLQQFSEEISWIEPEIFTIPETTLSKYIEDPSFEKYRFHLEKILRLKAHILSPKEEELIAAASRALQTPYKAFSSINNADFKFPSVKDVRGNPLELTHGRYQLYLQSRDRILRENAFKTLHGKYSEYENTLCDLIQGQLLSHQFEARVRKYNSCLEASLKPKNIEVAVYHSLISAVRENISALHSYIDLRKELLGLDPLYLYDMSVPLTKELDIHFDYNEAERLVIESVKPLGQFYQEQLQKGLLDERWVDRFENKNKRSGAYSSGCFDSQPYVLMNFKGIIRDVFTLAHECGHSMHSLLSRRTQPYHYADYPIFVAEVASTFNEELLFQLLLQRAKGKEEQIYLLTSRIDDIKATLFRQTQFAEFELLIHEWVEQNIPLTPELLKTEYRKLNQFYFGDAVHIDDTIDIEWARIPHFYYNFYVYQYATGISASIALAKRVLNGTEKERDAYLSFLKGGCSHYPIDLLKMAGVDMTTTEPVKAAIFHFKDLVSQLRKLSS